MPCGSLRCILARRKRCEDFGAHLGNKYVVAAGWLPCAINYDVWEPKTQEFAGVIGLHNLAEGPLVLPSDSLPSRTIFKCALKRRTKGLDKLT